MIIDLKHYSKIMKKILYLILALLVIYVILKLAYFFMPFLIALIIANCIEPLIQIISKRTKLLRKHQPRFRLY